MAVAVLLWAWLADTNEPTTRSGRAGAPEIERPSTRDRTTRDPAVNERSGVVEEDRVQLTGAIVLVDLQGGEHPTKSGQFRLRAWNGAIDSSQLVTVSAGRFTVAVPRATQLSIDNLVLGGQPLRDEYDSLEIPANGHLALRAHLTSRALLRVVDSTAGNDLGGVVIVQCMDQLLDGLAHPGSAQLASVVEHARSPVELPDESGTVEYWVRATGFAWKLISYDHSAGGERIVKLEAGGAVDVRLDNFDAASKAVVRFRGVLADNSVVLEAKPDEQGRCTLEHLAPGSYKVQVQIGLWFDDPLTLGEGRATVVAGGRSVVEIALESAPDRGIPVLLRGTLLVPEAWTVQQFSLGIQAVGPDRSEREVELSRCQFKKGATSEFAWKLGKVLPGLYVIDVDPFQYRLAIEVAAGAVEQIVRVELPEPAMLTVEVVDRVSGEPVTVKGIYWLTSFEPATSGSWERVTDAPASSFAIQVPAGQRVTVDVADSGFEAQRVEFDVRPGQNVVKLKLSRIFRFRLIVKDGTATVPLGHRFDVTVQHLGGEGKVAARWSDDTTSTFRVTTEGRYLLKFGPIKGFEDLPDKEIEIRGGEIIDVEVAAKRKE
jgi:hypothetical protein